MGLFSKIETLLLQSTIYNKHKINKVEIPIFHIVDLLWNTVCCILAGILNGESIKLIFRNATMFTHLLLIQVFPFGVIKHKRHEGRKLTDFQYNKLIK